MLKINLGYNLEYDFGKGFSCIKFEYKKMDSNFRLIEIMLSQNFCYFLCLQANVRDVRNAISSAVDVMHAMGPSICYLLPKVEGTYPLMYELSEVIETESFMLTECRELMASIAALQVQESSLEAHLVQLKQQNQPAE